MPFPELSRVNAYLLADDDGSVLVDCGLHDPSSQNDHGWGHLVAALEACDATPRDIATLIVTHPHIDHYGMAGRLVDEVGCELWMHALAGEDLVMYRDPESRVQRLRSMLSDHGVAPDDVEEVTAFEDWRPWVSSFVEPTRALEGGETATVGGRSWEIVYTPGHSRSHVCLWDSERSILISGDHLLPKVTPHIDFHRGWDEDPLGQYLDSLRRVEELDPGLVLPGHGRPFDDGAERARVTARHHDRRLGAILQVVRDRPRTAQEITQEIFGSELLNFQKRLALGEALAHLAYLRRRGDVERIRSDDGVYTYRKARRDRPPEDEE